MLVNVEKSQVTKHVLNKPKIFLPSFLQRFFKSEIILSMLMLSQLLLYQRLDTPAFSPTALPVLQPKNATAMSIITRPPSGCFIAYRAMDIPTKHKVITPTTI